MLLSLSMKCRKYGEQCLDPGLLLVARGSAWDGDSSTSYPPKRKNESAISILLAGIGEDAASGCLVGTIITLRERPRKLFGVLRVAAARLEPGCAGVETGTAGSCGGR